MLQPTKLWLIAGMLTRELVPMITMLSVAAAKQSSWVGAHIVCAPTTLFVVSTIGLGRLLCQRYTQVSVFRHCDPPPCFPFCLNGCVFEVDNVWEFVHWFLAGEPNVNEVASRCV